MESRGARFVSARIQVNGDKNNVKGLGQRSGEDSVRVAVKMELMAPDFSLTLSGVEKQINKTQKLNKPKITTTTNNS